jgi:autotransporter-associated beta strand protein
VELSGNGQLDVSQHDAPGMTIGSLEGAGNVFLGQRNLVVGSRDLSTAFSGLIRDGGIAGGVGGSVTKSGSGSLILTGANTYTGGTSINAGRVLANNPSGSALGSGTVTVTNSGSVVGGTGSISAPISINSGASLLGGDAKTANGSLRATNNVTLNGGSIVQLLLGPSGAHSSLTRVGGVWFFAPNQQFTFLDLGAQVGIYDNIITGLASDPGNTSSWTITNAGFTGTFIYDGAGSVDLNLTAASGPVLQLTAAVSRKMHGGLGPFDVPLPLSGEPGVECRSTGGNHTLVFTFSNNVVAGNVSLTTGEGVAGGPIFSGNLMSVNLTGIADAQKITVSLTNVRDTLSQILPDKIVKINILAGDSNGNRTVNASDIALLKLQAGVPVSAANFRADLNANGAVNTTDIALSKATSGHTLPPKP